MSSASVPTVLPEIKKIIRSVKYKEAKKIADKVLSLPTEVEIKDYLASVLKETAGYPLEALDTAIQIADCELLQGLFGSEVPPGKATIAPTCHISEIRNQ